MTTHLSLKRNDGKVSRVQLSGGHQAAEVVRVCVLPTGSHEIWFNEQSKRYTTVPRHPGAIPEGTLRAILRQAGIAHKEFLRK